MDNWHVNNSQREFTFSQFFYLKREAAKVRYKLAFLFFRLEYIFLFQSGKVNASRLIRI